jgi:hypothetical protein
VILSSTTFRAFKSVWKPVLKQIFAAVIFCCKLCADFLNVIFTAFGAGFAHGASFYKWAYDGAAVK